MREDEGGMGRLMGGYQKVWGEEGDGLKGWQR